MNRREALKAALKLPLLALPLSLPLMVDATHPPRSIRELHGTAADTEWVRLWETGENTRFLRQLPDRTEFAGTYQVTATWTRADGTSTLKQVITGLPPAEPKMNTVTF